MKTVIINIDKAYFILQHIDILFPNLQACFSSTDLIILLVLYLYDVLSKKLEQNKIDLGKGKPMINLLTSS